LRQRILEQHRAALKQVSTVLQIRGRIDGVEVAEIIEAATASDIQPTLNDY
jgi:hypothetical protein